jgi:hypothetical protein
MTNGSAVFRGFTPENFAGAAFMSAKSSWISQLRQVRATAY